MSSMNKAGASPAAATTRRAKKLLAPSVKYEIFLQLMRGETTINQAAEVAGVDRSTIMKLRQVAKEGAMAALSASKPGVGKTPRDVELEAANAEVARLSEAVKELAVKLTLLEGKGGSGWR
jgi:transposase-like protein